MIQAAAFMGRGGLVLVRVGSFNVITTFDR
jgi:hypothetical protein